MVVTYTISIDEDGNVHNDTQTYDSTFAQVYKAFHDIRREVDRQIAERRNCPYNPANETQAARNARADREADTAHASGYLASDAH